MRAALLLLFCTLMSCAAGTHNTPTHSWYEDMSVDFSVDYNEGVYKSVGLSYPIRQVYVYMGMWFGTDFSDVLWGPYVGFGWSWKPFSKK